MMILSPRLASVSVLVFLSCLAVTALHAGDSSAGDAQAADWVVVVHGGAGAVTPGTYEPDDEAGMRADLAAALEAAGRILAEGGNSLDAVTEAVRRLEDSPHFNAGRGAVFTADARNELDASIMLGSTGAAGAVAGVQGVRNPILAARAVMERSPHVMLSGSGAEAFARDAGLAFMPVEWFHTERRRRALEAIREDTASLVPPVPAHGTVGAVAIDAAGVLAAATSTGGMTNKRWGRIGDSPIIGAGTWADERCAVSATGWGEYYIRAVAAYDICARLAYLDESLDTAARYVVLERIPAMGGDGGVIALDRAGNVSMPFNTAGMARGMARADGLVEVALFKDE
ncbi:MAG: isoaspartyl peptidase/L-asparaginase [Gammaproteobacteria bacterium]|nr:isoaspartyl peptidase/L-asparaginase [Gammaproteobacteria bacterium]